MPYTTYTLQPILKTTRAQEQASTSANSGTVPSGKIPFNANITTSPINPAQQVSDTITSVSAWETDIYCGTTRGTVLHFVIDDSSVKESSFPARLENRINLNLGKKSVDKILLLPQVSKAVVLCDSTLSFFSLPFFDPIPTAFIQPIKGVFCFSHDVAEDGNIGEDGTIELAVVRRRTLQIFKIGETMYLKKELPLSDNAITLTRHGHMVCLADYQNYKLINLKHSTVTPLIPIPQTSAPIATSPTLSGRNGVSPNVQLVPSPKVAVVKKDEFLVVNGSVDNQTIGIFVNANGDAIRGTLQWTSYPQALCVEFPYIAALLRNNTIEVHNIQNQTLLQTLQLEAGSDAQGMSFVHGIKVWMNEIAEKLRRQRWPATSTHQNTELDNRLEREIARHASAAARILVFGKDMLMAQLPTPLVVRADSLLKQGLLEEALQLAERAKNTMSTTDGSVHTENLKAELNYTLQKAGLLLLEQTLFDDAFTLLSDGNMDPRVVVHLFEGLSQDKWMEQNPPVLICNGVRHVLEEIGNIKYIVNNNLEGVTSENAATAGADFEEQPSKNPSPNMRRILLMNAREALLKYLKNERSKRSITLSDETETVRTVIDTSLLKIYLSLKDDASIIDLLQQPNMCSIEDCSKTLTKAKKYYALSIMYKSKNMFEKVLELWTKLYSGELVDPSFKDGLANIKELLLQNIPSDELPLSVLMKYAWWLASKNAKDGVEVFLKSARAKDMDPDEILEKLEEYSTEGVRTYLEHLVISEKSDRPDYHTKLALSYVNDVHHQYQRPDRRKDIEDLVKRFKQVQTAPRKCDAEGIETDQIEQRTFVNYLASQKDKIDVIELHLKLIDLLQSSELYSPEAILEELKEPAPLRIEEAIVHGRLRHHKEAISILVQELQDFAGAETYCITNGKSIGDIPRGRIVGSVSFKDKPLPPLQEELKDMHISEATFAERRALFTMLFESYVAVENSDLMTARSIHLLNTQGMYFDTLKILPLIPDYWPIQQLQDFVVRSLRRSLNELDESKIVLGLSRGENLLVSSDLFKLYEVIGPVEIEDQTVCVKCHRLLGTSVFVRESEHGQLLHLHCAKLLGHVDVDE